MTTAADSKTISLQQQHRHKLPTGVLDIDHDPQTGAAYAACFDGVYCINVETGQHKKLYHHNSYASGVRVTHGGKQLVSGSYDGTLKWFDLEQNLTVRTVQAHHFWSWNLDVSDRYVVSSTGQYLAGGYDYEPAAEMEPSVQVFELATGEHAHALPHIPPVQSVAISPDGKRVAAANLMGEFRVWDIESGQQVSQWLTKDFTSFGIIKSHCQIGGVYALSFSPDGIHVLGAGMGPMRDPMAGNGKQLWQRFDWQTGKMIDQTKKGQNGEGLMETLAFSSDGRFFVMGGRLRGGEWNAAVFETETGERKATLKTKCRICKAVFTADGKRLLLGGAQGQPKKPPFDNFGRFDVLEITS